MNSGLPTFQGAAQLVFPAPPLTLGGLPTLSLCVLSLRVPNKQTGLTRPRAPQTELIALGRKRRLSPGSCRHSGTAGSQPCAHANPSSSSKACRISRPARHRGLPDSGRVFVLLATLLRDSKPPAPHHHPSSPPAATGRAPA